MENEVWGALGALKESPNHLGSKREARESFWEAIFPDFSGFWSPLWPQLGRAGMPKSYFSGKIPEETKKNEVQEPFLKKHEIWMENGCENERAGRVKTSVLLHTSSKI